MTRQFRIDQKTKATRKSALRLKHSQFFLWCWPCYKNSSSSNIFALATDCFLPLWNGYTSTHCSAVSETAFTADLFAVKRGAVQQALSFSERTSTFRFFLNQTFSKTKLKQFIAWCVLTFGEKRTVDLMNMLKDLGYHYATRAGISLAIDDLIIP